jgi:hypothetical protein
MLFSRSRVDEANPVVTGRADTETANVVFPGWRGDEAIQRRVNPFVELTEVRALRDRVLRKFLLKPGHITGVPTKDLAVVAQLTLILTIIKERGWGRDQLEPYFGIQISDDEWAGFFPEGGGMNPRYAPRDPEGRMNRLVEEVGEVMIEAGALLQLIGKAKRFGLDSAHPDGGPTNRIAIIQAMEGLRREMGDLEKAGYLVETDLLDGFAGEKAREALGERP